MLKFPKSVFFGPTYSVLVAEYRVAILKNLKNRMLDEIGDLSS